MFANTFGKAEVRARTACSGQPREARFLASFLLPDKMTLPVLGDQDRYTGMPEDEELGPDRSQTKSA